MRFNYVVALTASFRFVSAGTSAALAAQAPEISLRSAMGPIEHEFNRIGSVRELTGGRLLVSDVGEKTLYSIDLRSGSAHAVGRQGSGPGEYRDLGKLVPIGADTTLIADRSNRRYFVLNRDQIVRTTAPDDSVLEQLGFGLVGADSTDRVLAASVRRAGITTAARRRAQIALLMLERASGRLDTIAVLRDAEVVTHQTGAAPRTSFSSIVVTLSVAEQAVIAADGWVAIALQDPYRVNWIAPSGAVRRGRPLESAPAPVTDVIKQEWRRRTERLLGRPLPISLQDLPWAFVIPPYRTNALHALSDGRLLIERETVGTLSRAEYDLIDRHGDRVGVVVLAGHERVVGIGPQRVFVSTTDDDGVERLRVYTSP